MEKQALPARSPDISAHQVGALPPVIRPLKVAYFKPLVEKGWLGFDGGDPVSRAELRALKRSVLQCAFGELKNPLANVLMITSALPGSGKTFLSANLAQALAMEKDRTVLVIDADDTRSTLSRALGLYGVPGLFDALHNPKFQLEDCCFSSDLEDLSFIPAGSRFEDALELLTSGWAVETVQKLAKENPNRLVVIDCPPLLGTPNAVAIAGLVGQILVVVEAGETSRSTITQALELLNRDKPIGLVLNKIPRTPLLTLANGSYYYYYEEPAKQF